jgi:dihydroxyacetone kinase-like predicted kinase
VTRGQPLAIVGGEVVAADNGPLAALREVATHLQVDRAEIVTVLIGDDVGDDERRLSVELVQELAPDAELEVVDARQWPTRYWVGVE